MPKSKKGKRLPSQVKYDDKCPVLSGRVPLCLYDRAHAVMKEEGLSFADIIETGLEKFGARKRDEKEIRDKAYKEGYEAAKKQYAVYYSCSVCKKPIAISSDASKKAASQFMEQKGWRHTKCPQ